MNRRTFLKNSGAGVAASSLPLPASTFRVIDKPLRGRIFKSIKIGMFREKLSLEEKFQLLK